LKTEILDEQVISGNGSFSRVKRWIKGWHPEVGTLSFGLQGEETIEDKSFVKPIGTFEVHGEIRKKTNN
jgi:hypothetical protein